MTVLTPGLGRDGNIEQRGVVCREGREIAVDELPQAGAIARLESLCRGLRRNAGGEQQRNGERVRERKQGLHECLLGLGVRGCLRSGAAVMLLQLAGDAAEAVERYPTRLNVAAAALLATGTSVHVELAQDPKGRRIELTATGSLGTVRVSSTPSPRSVALSLLATLRRLQQPIQFG